MVSWPARILPLPTRLGSALPPLSCRRRQCWCIKWDFYTKHFSHTRKIQHLFLRSNRPTMKESSSGTSVWSRFHPSSTFFEFSFSWITNQTSIREKNRYNASTGQYFLLLLFISCWANGQHHFHHPSPVGFKHNKPSARHVWPLPMWGVGRRDLWDGLSWNQHHYIGYAVSIKSHTSFFSLTRMIDTTHANLNKNFTNRIPPYKTQTRPREIRWFTTSSHAMQSAIR